MILAALDIETTGLLAPDHRIIEVYIDLIRDDKVIWSYEQRIDPQRGIDAEALRVHKITPMSLMGKPTWQTVGPVVHKILSKADGYIWHNGDEFDGKFLAMEFKRIGLKMPELPALDTMIHGVWATPDGKRPRLSELCFACGVDYDPALAHAAAYDVQKMVECYFKAKAWGFYPDVFAMESSQAA